MFTLIQISDTHLSSTDPVGHHGWALAAGYIEAVRPDLVVNTGDIVREDPASAPDHAYAIARHRELPVPWVALAGNHDIGDGLPNRPVIEEDLRVAFERSYGAAAWHRDLDGWRLVGLCDLLFDTASDAEDRQWQWLETVLSGAGERRLALFMHKPPLLLSPDEIRNSSMTVPQYGGQRLWRLVERHRVELIACGHRHEYRSMRIGGTSIVWAPTTSNLLADRTPPQPRFTPVPGLVEYRFVENGFIHTFIPLSAIEEQQQARP